MIILPLQLLSARGPEHNRMLGTIIIDNQSGGGKRRDYRIRAYDKRAAALSLEDMLRHAEPFREGSVHGHASDAESAWVLVLKGLLALGYKAAAEHPDLFRDFSTAHARRDDPETSKAAAEAATYKLTENRMRVLRWFAERGRQAEATDPELTVAMDGKAGKSTWRTRRKELTDMGLLEPTGNRYAPDGHTQAHDSYRITESGLQREAEAR